MQRQTARAPQPAPQLKKPVAPRPVHPLIRLQQSLGNQAAGRLVQAKLNINQPGDEYEWEAERVADTVMRMPAPQSDGHRLAITPLTSHGAQRKCAECEEVEDEGALQRKESGSAATAPATAPPIVDRALNSPGQPLDAVTRAFFEPRFGQDFSHVLVHTNAQAAESTRAVNALAYTIGRDVVFGTGQYAPHSETGRRLLAHELTHVMQQWGRGNSLQRFSAEDVFWDLEWWFELALACALPPQGVLTALAVYQEEHPLVGYLKIWGQAIAGDFIDDPTFAATVLRTILTLIPGVDTVADVEDLVAAVYQLVILKRYGEAGPWINFVLSLIGYIPAGIGSVLEGVARGILLKGGGLALDIAGGGVELLARQFPELSTFVKSQGNNLIEGAWAEANHIREIIAMLELPQMLDSKFSSWSERMDDVLKQFGERIISPLGEVRTQLNTRIDEVLTELRNGAGLGIKQSDDAMDVGAAVPSGGRTLPATPAATSPPVAPPTPPAGVEPHAETPRPKEEPPSPPALEPAISPSEQVAEGITENAPTSAPAVPGSETTLPPGESKDPVMADAPEPDAHTKAPLSDVDLDAAVSQSSDMPNSGIMPQDKANEAAWVDSHPEVVTVVETPPPPRRHAKIGDNGKHEIVERPGGGCERQSDEVPIPVPCPLAFVERPTLGFASPEGEVLPSQRANPLVDPDVGSPIDEPEFDARVDEPELDKFFDDPESETPRSKRPKDRSGKWDTTERTRREAGVSLAERHHIATKYRDENIELLESVGLTIDDDLNLTVLEEHGQMRGWYDWENGSYNFKMKGHHEAYNEWVTDQLNKAVELGTTPSESLDQVVRVLRKLKLIISDYPEVLQYGPNILPPEILKFML